MKNSVLKSVLAGFLPFLIFSGTLAAQTKRAIPLDMSLIIDDSDQFAACKEAALDWINREIIDGILQEGDSITLWAAGDSARIIHRAAVDSQKDDIKNSLGSLETAGKKAEFAEALKEASASPMPSSTMTSASRLNVTMLVSGSTRALSESMAGNAGLFRWSRVIAYSGWRVLVASPGIGDEVRRAASGYMNSFR